MFSLSLQNTSEIHLMKKYLSIVVYFALLIACTPNENSIPGTNDPGGNSTTIVPSITGEAYQISAVSAILAGKANLGSSSAADLQVGFQYSKTAGILPSNSTTVGATDADANYNYTTPITGLEPGTKYYFRSFIRQDGLDTYGETKEFTTKEVSSLMETLDASNVEATIATLNAKLDLTDVLYDKLTYGFYWGTTAFSDTANFKCQTISDNAISASLKGLSHNTQHWYKAYVNIDGQTLSGDSKTFTTGIVHVDSIILNKTEYTFNKIGNTLSLQATVLPADATDKTLEWSSDNDSVATVNQYGVVTAIDNGSATITVKTKDKGVIATCKIVVSATMKGLTVSANYFGDYYGKGFHDYILLFQLKEIGNNGAFVLRELSLEVLTAQGAPTYLPEGVYEITNANFNTAGIVPSIEKKDKDGNTVFGETYLYSEDGLEAIDKAILTVAVNDSDYIINAEITAGGKDYSFYYYNALSIADHSQDEPDGPEGDYEFVPDGADAFNRGHEWGNDTDDWELYLVNSKDDREWIVVEFVTDARSNISELPTGNFNVPADFYTSDTILAGTLCPFYQIADDNYGTYYVYGNWIWYKASAGDLKISKSGDYYTIEISFTVADYDNAKVTAKYVGTVSISIENYNDGLQNQTAIKKAMKPSKITFGKKAVRSKRQIKSVYNSWFAH